LKTAGGRVLDVTAYHPTSQEKAQKRAYEATHKIDFEGKDFRRDIGHQAVLGFELGF
jgi:phosphoribosylamine--glycine ligase